MDCNDPPEKYVISGELDLCEGCGEWKPVIIRVRRRFLIADWFRDRIEGVNKDAKKN